MYQWPYNTGNKRFYTPSPSLKKQRIGCQSSVAKPVTCLENLRSKIVLPKVTGSDAGFYVGVYILDEESKVPSGSREATGGTNHPVSSNEYDIKACVWCQPLKN
jgi:hypothetical protein